MHPSLITEDEKAAYMKLVLTSDVKRAFEYGYHVGRAAMAKEAAEMLGIELK